MRSLTLSGSIILAGIVSVGFYASPLFAHEMEVAGANPEAPVRANSHAPIGVMGDHMHKAGEWMVSYRYMRMDMSGLRAGSHPISPVEALDLSAGYRILPLQMSGDMHMLGLMYAPTDWLTMMFMGSYIDKEMELQTYTGMSGTTPLGTFHTRSKGVGDTKISGMFRLFDDNGHHVHINLGVSLPTGATKKSASVLMPTGMVMEKRLPYGMQLGSGSVDALVGLTYTGFNSAGWNWGMQYRGRIPFGENDENYKLGDIHTATAWLAYSWQPWISLSGRIEGQKQSRIDGSDALISGKVPMADSLNYGGDRIIAYAGINLAGQRGFIRNHRIALEVGVPVRQKLNGIQLEKDTSVTLGYQYSF